MLQFCKFFLKTTFPKYPVHFFVFQTYYLEEFESLIDELLFRLNALSNCLHHNLPPKAHHYMEEESPIASPIQEPSNMDTQVSQPHVKHAEKTRRHMHAVFAPM